MANNPRKFSEKIALQKQRQAEGTAEFERVMRDIIATKVTFPLFTPSFIYCLSQKLRRII